MPLLDSALETACAHRIFSAPNRGNARLTGITQLRLSGVLCSPHAPTERNADAEDAFHCRLGSAAPLGRRAHAPLNQLYLPPTRSPTRRRDAVGHNQRHRSEDFSRSGDGASWSARDGGDVGARLRPLALGRAARSLQARRALGVVGYPALDLGLAVALARTDTVARHAAGGGCVGDPYRHSARRPPARRAARVREAPLLKGASHMMRKRQLKRISGRDVVG